MAAIIRNALVGVGTLSAAAVGSFAYWVNGKTKDLPPDQKGNIFPRMKEVVDSFQQSKKIQDTYTAERHLDLASSLSSRQFTLASDKSQKEVDALKTSYYAGYIPEALRKNPGVTSPIFRYDQNLPVILPTLPGETHKGFIFAGSTPQIHDTQARDSIFSGDYVRCKSELAVVDPNAKNSWDKSKKVDVVITGTTDQRKCSHFKNDFLKDVAYLAASNQGNRESLDAEHPYSDTPVFDCSEKGIEQTGDLTDIPQQTKEKILLGDRTACNFYSLQKTRLSGGSYKEVGAIVIGATGENVCQDLHFGHMRKLIAQSKKQ